MKKMTDVKRFLPGRYSIALPVVLTMAGIVAAPQAALSSARDGLNLFMTVVLPSLLPFSSARACCSTRRL